MSTSTVINGVANDCSANADLWAPSSPSGPRPWLQLDLGQVRGYMEGLGNKINCVFTYGKAVGHRTVFFIVSICCCWLILFLWNYTSTTTCPSLSTLTLYTRTYTINVIPMVDPIPMVNPQPTVDPIPMVEPIPMTDPVRALHTPESLHY